MIDRILFAGTVVVADAGVFKNVGRINCFCIADRRANLRLSIKQFFEIIHLDSRESGKINRRVKILVEIYVVLLKY